MTWSPASHDAVAEATRRPLGELDESERYELFDRLQARLPQAWEAVRMNHADESVVVVPSVTSDPNVPNAGSLNQAYEERFLFLLLLLRQPQLRMTYVTSMPISPTVVEYYLALLPGVIPSHARARLSLVSVGDSSPSPLTEKLLARPRLLGRIADTIPNPERSHLVPYNTTELERDLALILGIPMYGADPRLAELGSKTGCRRLFGEVGVQYPVGAEEIRTPDDMVEAINDMRRQRPGLSTVIVKLNEGVSGRGNAVVDLSGLPAEGPADREQVLQRIMQMQLESTTTTLEAYLASFAEMGGIVEERIVGEEIRSPSVQLRVTPAGVVELLSTHDQLLGGASGQSYLGCAFPADPGYAGTIGTQALAVGQRLREMGTLGRFAIDFVVVRGRDGSWATYAIELNLRKGGTTHPFLTLQFLTDGRYEGDTCLFRTPDGHEKHLVATDHLESHLLRALSTDDLFDIVARHGLHFDQSSQTGVVFHMISCLSGCGRLGMTAVGDTPEQAMALYERAQDILLAEAAAARQERALPG